MASRSDLEHTPTDALERNRQRMRGAQAKIRGMHERGTREPSLVAPEPALAGAAKGSSRDPMGREPAGQGAARSASNRQSDFELIEGREDDVLGLKRWRARKERVAQDNVSKKNQGRSDARGADLSIPAVRAVRLTTEDGRTSFHFSHDSVAKTGREVVSETGLANRPGAAREHNRYIERESAVAVDAEAVERDPSSDVEEGLAPAADAIAVNDNDGAAVEKQESNLVRPELTERFHRTYRAALGALVAGADDLARGGQAGERDGLRDVPGGRVVPDAGDAQMLVLSDALPQLRGVGAGGQGLRRAGDGDRQDPGGRDGGAGGRLIRGARHQISRWLGRDEGEAPATRDVYRREGRRMVVARDEAKRRSLDAMAAPAPTAANDPRTAEGQGVYIERQEALARQPDGTRVLFTNIDDDAGRRAEFWRLVEEHERDADPDRISFRIADDPAFWERVAKHAECPRPLVDAIAAANPDKPVRVQTDGNVAMRAFLSKIEGWREVGGRRPGETPEDYRNRRAESLCRFHDGRGGRIQYRIVGELPHELDVAGRASILREFSDEFAKRKLPYVAVMHAPDHTNNDRNWHFHLVYYDRPASRMTAERLAGKPADPNERNTVVETPGEADVGRWDFSLKERYRTSSREVRERYPFAQPKSKEVNRDQAWIEILRDSLAKATNDHLMRAGVQRRVDPRRHSEMGIDIHADPQEHLGTRLSNLESMGIATPKGVANEERQWSAILQKLDRDLGWRRNAVDRTAKVWMKKLDGADLVDEEKARVRGMVTGWHQHRIEAEEHEAIALNVDQHMARLRSRAEKVRTTCTKHLQAIDAGKATRFQSTRRDSLRAKVDDAEAWLSDIDVQLVKETAFVAETREASRRERLLADGLELSIERALSTAGVKVEGRRAANDRGDEARRQAEGRAANDDAGRRERRQAMAAWVDEIVAKRRRLTRTKRSVHPADMTATDRDMLLSDAYDGVRVRLDRFKRAQDKIVADVEQFIQSKPEAVVRQQRSRRSADYGYVLVGARPALAEAFRDYASDPALVAAAEKAVAIVAERRAADAARVAAERARGVDATPVHANDPAPANDVAQTPAAEGRPATARTGDRTVDDRAGTDAPAPANDDRRAAVARTRAFAENLVRGINAGGHVVRVREGVAALSDASMRRLGVAEADMAEPALQKRLAGIARAQAREISRAVGYVRLHPERLVVRAGVASLAARAPAELADIVRRLGADEQVAAQLTAARDGARAASRQDGLPLAPIERRVIDVPTGRGRSSDDAGRDVPQVDPDRATPPRETVAPAPTSTPDRVDAATTDRDRRPAAAPRDERFTRIENDDEMIAEARRAAETRRLREEAEERRRDVAATRTGTGLDPSESAARKAAQDAALREGHPLLARWSLANEEGRHDDRRRLAFDIVNDRQARERLRDLDRAVARRIREEADLVAQERQPSLGLDLARGMGPAPGDR